MRVLVASALALLAVAILPGAAASADSAAPTQPGAITASNVTATSVALKWGASSDDIKVEGYRVYRGVADAPDSALALIGTTDAKTSYSATRLYSGTAYKFGVVAIDAAGNKSPMRTTTVTTAKSSDSVAPSVPSSSSVAVRPFSSARLDVVWAASTSSDVAGYRVFRNGVLVGTVDLPNGLRFSDNGLTASTTYSYAVEAVDSNGNASPATTGRNGTTPADGTVRIARGPYVSDVSGTTAILSWWTNLATPGTVGYGVASTAEQTATDPGGSVHHHTVRLTGLTPATTYRYDVGNGSVTSAATFRTAATPGQAFSFAAIGDFGGGSAGATQNGANIAGDSTSFIQTVGDNIYPTSGLPDPDFLTTYSDFDTRFYRPFGNAIKSQAFFPANGNKEYYDDGEFWGNFPMPGDNHSWYGYDWGDAHILVLDSEQPFEPGSAQYAFAEADLAAHQAARWRIVATQRPPYSSATVNSSSEPAQQYLVPLFQQERVALVLSGNSHNYERTLPMIDGVPKQDGITYVVTGAGGNGFNAFTLAQPAYSAFREAAYYQYTRVTVSPAEIKLEGVQANTNGVFDSATITKP